MSIEHPYGPMVVGGATSGDENIELDPDYWDPARVYRGELETHYESASVRISVPEIRSESVSVVRTDAVFGSMTVRGSENRAVVGRGGKFLIEDAEVPLDTPLRYCVIEDFGDLYSSDSCQATGWSAATVTNAKAHPSKEASLVASSMSLVEVRGLNAMTVEQHQSYFITFGARMGLTDREVLGPDGTEYVGIRWAQLRVEITDPTASPPLVHRFASEPVEVTPEGIPLRLEFTVPGLQHPPDSKLVAPPSMPLRVAAAFGDDLYAQSQAGDVIDLLDKDLGTGRLFRMCARRGIITQRNLIPNPSFHETSGSAPWRMAVPPAYGAWNEPWATLLPWYAAAAAWDEEGLREGTDVCISVERKPGSYIAPQNVGDPVKMFAPVDVEVCHTYPPPGCGWGWEGRVATTVYGVDPETTVKDAFFLGPVPCANNLPSVPVPDLIVANAAVDFCLGGAYSLTEDTFSVGMSPTDMVRLNRGRPFNASVEAHMIAGRRKARLVVDLYHNDPANHQRELVRYGHYEGPWVELLLNDDKLLTVPFGTDRPPAGFETATTWVHFSIEFADRGDGTAAPRDAVYIDPDLMLADTGPGQVASGHSSGMILGGGQDQRIIVDSGIVVDGDPPTGGVPGTPVELSRLVRIPKTGGGAVCQNPPEPDGYVAGDRYRLTGRIIIVDDRDIPHPVVWRNAGLVFGAWNQPPATETTWAGAVQHTWDGMDTAPLYLVVYGHNDDVLAVYSLGPATDTAWFDVDITFTAPAGTESIGLATGPAHHFDAMGSHSMDPLGTQWRLDSFGLEHEDPNGIPIENNPWRLKYLDGYEPLPTRDPWLTVPDGGDWEIGWCGEPHCSASFIRAPAKLKWCLPETTLSSKEGAASVGIDCVSVHFVDPVLPHAGAWAVFQNLDSWQLPARLEKIPVIHRYTPVAINDLRESRTGTINVITTTLAQRSRMYRMLNYGRVLLLQFSRIQNWGETALYIAIDNVDEEYLGDDMSRPERKWKIPFQVVNRPLGLISSAVRVNWDEVANTTIWENWRGVQFKVPDWEDLVFNDFDDPYNEEIPSPISGGVFPVDYSVPGVLVPRDVQPMIESEGGHMTLHAHTDAIRSIGPGSP